MNTKTKLKIVSRESADRMMICPVFNEDFFEVEYVNLAAAAKLTYEADTCCVVVADSGFRDLTECQQISRHLPLVIISPDYLVRDLEIKAIGAGAHEVLGAEELSPSKFLRVLKKAEARFQALEDARSRDKMFTVLCDALPYQMAYRIIKKPGEKARFHYVSQGVFHISGLTREEIINDSSVLYEQIEPEDKPAFQAAEARAVEDLKPFEMEVRKRDASGRLHWVHIRSFPTKLKNGTIIWDGTESDITSYKEAEESVKELLAKNQLLLESERHARSESERNLRIKDDFLATLSHELRTPINAVLGWVQLIKLGRLSAEETRKAIDVMERNARTQSQLIADLLDMNRIMSGKIHLSMESVDVRQFALAAVESIRPAAEAKNVHIDFAMDAGLDLYIHGDNSKLQQVMWNLLTNAVKFTPSNGRINVRILEIGEEVEFSIRDSGVGIKQEFIPYVFDRFKQADSSFARKFGGLGLGLAIVKHLVLLHGGSVRAHSDGEAKGATFTIRFPLAKKNAELSDGHLGVKNAEGVSAFSLKNLRVLVLDDETDALELIKQILVLSGARVHTASDADTALGIISDEKCNFDLIFSDIGMPGKDGFEFIKELRQRFPAAHSIPVIALTAFARLEDRSNILAAGFCRHITKPIDAADLLSNVYNTVRQNKQEIAANM